MNNSKTPKLDSKIDKLQRDKDEAIRHADALYHHVKDRATEFYEEGRKTATHAQDNIKVQRDNLVKHVQDKPLTSILIAAGVGFILSAILKK